VSWKVVLSALCVVMASANYAEGDWWRVVGCILIAAFLLNVALVEDADRAPEEKERGW
jgi:hypothetical protein